MSPRLAHDVVDTTTFLWGLLGLVSVPAAGFLVMMFDAPGSTDNLSTYFLAASVMSFPLACLLSVSMSWQTLRTGAFSKACLWTLLPLANIVIGAAVLTWISFVQDGRFNG